MVLALTGLQLLAQTPPNTPSGGARRVPRYTPPTTPATTAPAAAATAPGDEVAGIVYDFQGVDVNQVLDIYAKLVNRTILRAGLPDAKIVLKTQTPLTRSEAIEALHAVLALKGAYARLLDFTLASLGFSLYLAHIEKEVLGVWCIYCVISLGIIALMTLLTVGINVPQWLGKRAAS